MTQAAEKPLHKLAVEKKTTMTDAELNELAIAMEDAIRDGIGFNWLAPPMRETLESYARGVLMVPSRSLFVGKLDGTIASAIQLVRPSKTKETSAFAATIEAHFVAPWARGHGLALMLLAEAEREASLSSTSRCVKRRSARCRSTASTATPNGARCRITNMSTRAW